MPAAVAGWAGGLSPCSFVRVWLGGGGDPAPNYIENISMLWLLLLWRPDFAYSFPLGKRPAERVTSRLGCLKASIPPGCGRDGENEPHPARHALLPSMEQLVEQLMEQQWSCPMPEEPDSIPAEGGVLPAARDMCAPLLFISAGEGLARTRSLLPLA